MFQLEPKTGLLSPARFLPSPHCDARSPEAEISLLVIHNISLPAGEFGTPYIEALFMNRLQGLMEPSAMDYPKKERDRQALMEVVGMHVSSHLVIDRAGNVTQYVPFGQRAWHAGVSEFKGQPRCNDFSIGIELEGTDNIPYTDEQYQALAEVSQILLAHYPLITRDRIVGHSDIAPGRKTDPGDSFDWDRFLKLL